MPDLHILPEVDGVPTYVEVINIDSSLSQTELFNRAKIWFVDNYNSAKNVIQMEDKESGILIAKGAIPIKYNAQIESNNDSISREINLDIYHTIKIYLKQVCHLR